MIFALESKIMELYTLVSLLALYVDRLDFSNPAWVDLIKMIVGVVSWIGGLTAFLYWRQLKLKKAIN
jgi:hypothetical protein